MSIEKIILHLAEFTDVKKEDINESSNLVDDLGMTSFDLIGLVEEIDEKYNIHVSSDQFKEINTVQDIINLFN